MRSHVLVVRCDGIGGVMLAGPAVRAITAHGHKVTFLAGPRGQAAASLLPGVERVVEFPASWLDRSDLPVIRSQVDALTEHIALLGIDLAVILTSCGQSPLPLALLLRLAGVRQIVAATADDPGTLLDVNHEPDGSLHEVERNLALVQAVGWDLPSADDGRLQIDDRVVDRALPHRPVLPDGYVVVHPGASLAVRGLGVTLASRTVELLHKSGRAVAITGSQREYRLAETVAGDLAINLAGRTDLDCLAAIMSRAAAVICGDTGLVHLSAAVGAPIVTLGAVEEQRVPRRPWKARHVLVHARLDRGPGGSSNTCINEIAAEDLVAAMDSLVGRG